MGAVLKRLCHQFLSIRHGGWLYVDDFLLRLEAETAPLIATCIGCFLHLLGCPITKLSWDDKYDGLASTSSSSRVSGKYRKTKETKPSRSCERYLDKVKKTGARGSRTSRGPFDVVYASLWTLAL